MGALSDSVNLLGNSKDKPNKDKIIIPPYGEMERNWPLTFEGDKPVMAYVESYNRKTRVVRLSYIGKCGDKHYCEIEMHNVSEEDFKAGLEREDKEIPLFNLSGQLIHL